MWLGGQSGGVLCSNVGLDMVWQVGFVCGLEAVSRCWFLAGMTARVCLVTTGTVQRIAN